MSTLTVTNIETPTNITTGNSSAGQIVVNSNEVLLFTNNTTNVTINSSSIAIGGVVKANSSIGADGAAYSGNQVTISYYLILSGNVTPTKLAANTADLNAASGVYNIRLEANSTTVYYSLFGIVAGTNGQEITVTNINATPLFIRNEDSVNESTAANRFNMPNHIKLDGYMAAQFYYDGTLSRWKLVDSINIPLDYKSLLTKSFFISGYTGAAYSTRIDRTTHSTETTSSIAAVTTAGRTGIAATGSDTKGFASGGDGTGGPGPGSTFATAERVTYSSETIATVAGANLSQSRTYLSATGNLDKGFFCGGSSPTIVATADRTTYSTETTAAVSGANLSQARSNIAAVGNSDKGFFCGGSTPTIVATSGRTAYSTETHAAVSGANLSGVRTAPGVAGNSDKGICAGGSTPTIVATADRITYSTETTTAVSGANLSQARNTLGSAGNADKGFHAGGTTPTVVATADRTTYSSDTTAAVAGANLSQARWPPAAL
jgi:hypothetical protein